MIIDNINNLRSCMRAIIIIIIIYVFVAYYYDI